MFGVLTKENLNCREKAIWHSHYCSLCKSLKTNYGEISRFLTNRDAVLVSLLCQVQSFDSFSVEKQKCTFIGFKDVNVMQSNILMSDYAAALSCCVGIAKIDDTLVDGDSYFGLFPIPLKKIKSFLVNKVNNHNAKLNIDFEPLWTNLRKQSEVEKLKGRDFLTYSEPTESSIAYVFEETISISGHRGNRQKLSLLGKMYGRVIYLIDAIKDYSSDLRNGSFNPLAHINSKKSIVNTCEMLFSNAMVTMSKTLGALSLSEPSLFEKLLLKQLPMTFESAVATQFDQSYSFGETFSIVKNSDGREDDEERSKKKSPFDCADWCECGCNSCSCCCDTSKGDSCCDLSGCNCCCCD